VPTCSWDPVGGVIIAVQSFVADLALSDSPPGLHGNNETVGMTTLVPGGRRSQLSVAPSIVKPLMLAPGDTAASAAPGRALKVIAATTAAASLG
jgi:hypothetical protein